MQEPGTFVIVEYSNPSIFAYPCIFRILSNENFRIFRTLTYLNLDTYSELSQRFKIEFFAEIIENCN